MKLIIRLLLLLLSQYSLVGCYKISPLPIGPSIGYFKIDLNGKDWNKTYNNAYQTVESALIPYSGAYPCIEDHLDVFTELFSPEGYLRQSLYLTKIPKTVGTSKIIAAPAFHCDETDPVYSELYTITQDGDVVGDVYQPLEGADNYLHVEIYNSKTGEIKGTFQMTMVKTRDGGTPALPDTLRFTNGRFHTRFIRDYH
ncbi:hypothetical protein DYBT9623_03804 [Dyadobacter sp. CECT 9623]|uniref:Lipoprotein n=1 Tax=Dyadobacter linearis TaxID=2823330 RepID=A0ABM8UTZ6_9BACT|nr:hypothetical protein [Dyadobacter sp. CECT 9623]CAG5071820.1 hypothetical protein DYBT9623_03804 [Dyadobacter sp. CECT 9623]